MELLTRGTTINALVLPQGKASGSTIDNGTLRDYFEREVIGGRGAFAMVLNNRREFSQAILQKLVLEIAWNDP